MTPKSFVYNFPPSENGFGYFENHKCYRTQQILKAKCLCSPCTAVLLRASLLENAEDVHKHLQAVSATDI